MPPPRGRGMTGAARGLSPAPVLGHGLSAAGAWQCVAACHSLRAGTAAEAIVATTGFNQRAAALHLRPHAC